MALKHYYVEDLSVDPMREDRITPVNSIQFDELTEKTIIVKIEQPSDKGLIKTSVVIPLEELKCAYKWLSE